MVVMHPPEATPKNDMLLGWRPLDRCDGTGRMGKLTTLGAKSTEFEPKSDAERAAGFGSGSDEVVPGESMLMAPAQLTPECATGWAMYEA